MVTKNYLIICIFILSTNISFGHNSDSLKVFDHYNWDINKGWFGSDSLTLYPREYSDTTGWNKQSNYEIYEKYFKSKAPNFDTTKLQNMSKAYLYKMYSRLVQVNYYGDHIYRQNGIIIYKNIVSCEVGEPKKQIIEFVVKNNHLHIKYSITSYESSKSTEYEKVYDIDEWNEKRIILTICRG